MANRAVPKRKTLLAIEMAHKKTHLSGATKDRWCALKKSKKPDYPAFLLNSASF